MCEIMGFSMSYPIYGYSLGLTFKRNIVKSCNGDYGKISLSSLVS